MKFKSSTGSVVTGVLPIRQPRQQAVDFYKRKFGEAASVMKTDRATSISTGGHDKNKVLVNITSEEEKTRIAIVRITRTEN